MAPRGVGVGVAGFGGVGGACACGVALLCVGRWRDAAGNGLRAVAGGWAAGAWLTESGGGAEDRIDGLRIAERPGRGGCGSGGAMGFTEYSRRGRAGAECVGERADDGVLGAISSCWNSAGGGGVRAASWESAGGGADSGRAARGCAVAGGSATGLAGDDRRCDAVFHRCFQRADPDSRIAAFRF